MHPPAQFVILGNPDNRRVTMFQEALARLGLARAREIAYVDLFTEAPGMIDLDAELRALTAASSAPVVLRIDSPGEDFAVTRALLMRGARARADSDVRIPLAQAQALTYQRGRILAPAQQYAGYRYLLDEIADALDRNPRVTVMNAPGAVATLFDKAACRQHLQTPADPIGVPADVRMAPGIGTIASHDELRHAMATAGLTRAFVKLRHGSSASGVVAYRAPTNAPDDGDGECAVTSTAMSRSSGHLELFNSLKLREYRRPRDIRALIDALAAHQVVAESWIDKLRLDGARCDVRIVVIAGRARHAVVRCSDSPLTNLHLGNRRAPVAALVERIGETRWRAGRRMAEAAVARVPGLLYAGVDLMFEADTHAPYIVEVNAFGDLLPGIEDAGDDTYTAEIRAQLDLLRHSD